MSRGVGGSGLKPLLLADAELGEDATEKVVGGYRARDRAECLLAEPQLFGQQLAGPRFCERALAGLEVLESLAQGAHVAPARRETPAAFVTRLLAYVSAQRVEPLARLRR